MRVVVSFDIHHILPEYVKPERLIHAIVDLRQPVEVSTSISNMDNYITHDIELCSDSTLSGIAATESDIVLFLEHDLRRLAVIDGIKALCLDGIIREAYDGKLIATETVMLNAMDNSASDKYPLYPPQE